MLAVNTRSKFTSEPRGRIPHIAPDWTKPNQDPFWDGTDRPLMATSHEVFRDWTSMPTWVDFPSPADIRDIAHNTPEPELRQMFIQIIEAFESAWHTMDTTRIRSVFESWGKAMKTKENVHMDPIEIYPELQAAWEKQQARYANMSSEEIERDLDSICPTDKMSPNEERLVLGDVLDIIERAENGSEIRDI